MRSAPSSAKYDDSDIIDGHRDSAFQVKRRRRRNLVVLFGVAAIVGIVLM